MTTETDSQELAESIRDGFADDYKDDPEASLENVQEKVELFSQHALPEEDIRRGVFHAVANDLGITKDKLYKSSSGGGGDSISATVEEILDFGPDKWLSATVKVVAATSDTPDSMTQKALVGDETEAVEIVNWASSNIPELEEGEVYTLKNIVTNEYKGDINLGLNKNTEVEHLDGEEMTVESDRFVISKKMKVVNLFEEVHETMTQKGVIGDEEGTTVFVNWASTGLPALEVGEVYQVEAARINEYEGNTSLSFGNYTSITHLPDEDLEVGDNSEERLAVLVDVQKGSGLIRRNEDGKAIRNSEADENSTWDLRIKGVFDTGTDTFTAIIGRELTEVLSGITLSEAQEMAMDTMDHTVVMHEIQSRVIGKYYTVTGTQVGDNFLVDEIEVSTGFPEEMADEYDTDELLVRARSM